MTKAPNPHLAHLHFPKTAGTAFAQQLVGVLGERLAVSSWQQFEGADLSDTSWVHGHIYFDQIDQLPHRPTLTTMLRHPVERIHSLYRFHKRRPEDPMYERANSLTFHQFVDAGIGSQVYVSMLADAIDRETMRPVQTATGRDRIDLALSRLEQFDVIGITEHFEYSLLLLSGHLGLEPFWRVSTANTAPTPTLRDDIDESTIQLIGRMAGADIEIYNRAVELFRAQVRELQSVRVSA